MLRWNPLDGHAPYRDPSAAAQARLAALGEKLHCVECASVHARATVTIRDLRAAAGSFGILLGLLLVELFLVGLAHGAFGRFESSDTLTTVLATGAVVCGVLFWVAWSGRSQPPADAEDAPVLATLSHGGDVPCPKAHRPHLALYIRSFRCEQSERESSR